MKGKIFTILFSMIAFLAFAAPPIIPDPPVQKEKISIVSCIDYEVPFIYDVVDLVTMGNDVSIIPKDVNNIGISSDIIVSWIKDKDPGYKSSTLQLDYVPQNLNTVLRNEIPENINHLNKHYDPGRCN